MAGTSFNQPVITAAVFGEGERLFDVCWQNIVLTAMGLPGVAAAIYLLSRQWTSRALQVWGFALLALASLALAVAASCSARSGAA